MLKKVIIFVFVIILSVSAVMVINSHNTKKQENIERNVPYVLKNYENCVALYKGNEIIEVFQSVNFNALPEYDKNQLKKGITFNDVESVYSLIEDYDG